MDIEDLARKLIPLFWPVYWPVPYHTLAYRAISVGRSDIDTKALELSASVELKPPPRPAVTTKGYGLIWIERRKGFCFQGGGYFPYFGKPYGSAEYAGSGFTRVICSTLAEYARTGEGAFDALLNKGEKTPVMAGYADAIDIRGLMSALFRRKLVLLDLPVMSHVMAAMWCLKDLCVRAVSNLTLLSACWDVAIWRCASPSSFLKAPPDLPPGK